MKVTITEGMKFKSIHVEELPNEFIVEKRDYYEDGHPVWCAVTEKFVMPLDEIYLPEYMPQVDGKWINEPNEYIY